MRYENTAESMETHPSFHKDEESKLAAFPDDDQDAVYDDDDEQELQLEDVFGSNNANSNDGSTHMLHQSSGSSSSAASESLIRQFNASIGSKSLERSVAEFYLEMCDNDVQTAASFFKEQNGGAAPTTGAPQQQPQPSVPKQVPPVAAAAPVARAPTSASGRTAAKRAQSFDGGTSLDRHHSTGNRSSSHKPPRRIKSFDVAEAACVTAPSFHRSNHHSQSHSQQRRPPSRSSSSVGRRGGTAAPQLPQRRSTPWKNHLGRSHSERYVREAPVSASLPRLSSSTHSSRSPARARSYDQNLQASLKDLDYTERVVTRPPTATRGSSPPPAPSSRNYRAQQRPGDNSSWEPPTGHYNPAA